MTEPTTPKEQDTPPQQPMNLTGVPLSDAELAALIQSRQAAPVPPPLNLHWDRAAWERDLLAALRQEHA